MPDNDNEATEMWRGYRSEQQARRTARLPERQDEITQLASAGFNVRKVTEYHFRVDSTLDLYPIHRRWHNIKTGKRGTYSNPKEVAILYCRKSQT